MTAGSSIRIPFTAPLPAPIILPHSAVSVSGAIDAIAAFLTAPPSAHLRGVDVGRNSQTVLLTGAGISVASGLSDYRGDRGTYRRSQSYRPIYYHEFAGRHESRQRYWARSFVGWPVLARAQPNQIHWAIRDLAAMDFLSAVVTQNVDSFHASAHPQLPTVELHGALRSVVCNSCRNEFSRAEFQALLAALNPAWAEYLAQAVEAGALDTAYEDRQAEQSHRHHQQPQQQKGMLKLNPDGDIDLAQAPYSTFRYPPCPVCLERPPPLADGSPSRVEADGDGALLPGSNAGILKPAVVMFGENIDTSVRTAAEEAVDDAGKLLIVGSSLATYSAWRLVERAVQRGMSIGLINLGGVRSEAMLLGWLQEQQRPTHHVRCSAAAELVLPAVVSRLQPSA